jgi:hypothetical protein
VIKNFGRVGEDICELEEARHLLNFENGMIMVEGQRVLSFDDLLQLIAQDKFRDREYIEVVRLPAIAGG